MLKIDQVTRVFKQKHRNVTALDNVSLNIGKGEMIGITGPSGSGKSTLLLLMGGMSRPDQGKVFWEDKSIYDLPQNERAKLRSKKIGFIFQSFNLIPYLNVFENISLGLDLANGCTNKLEKINEVIAKMKLQDRLDHLPNELSVGQQQRVAIARALVKDPEIIFADEPTGNLDIKTSDAIMDILHTLNEMGKTVIIITHNPNISNNIKRNICIENGRVV